MAETNLAEMDNRAVQGCGWWMNLSVLIPQCSCGHLPAFTGASQDV